MANQGSWSIKIGGFFRKGADSALNQSKIQQEQRGQDDDSKNQHNSEKNDSSSDGEVFSGDVYVKSSCGNPSRMNERDELERKKKR